MKNLRFLFIGILAATLTSAAHAGITTTYDPGVGNEMQIQAVVGTDQPDFTFSDGGLTLYVSDGNGGLPKDLDDEYANGAYNGTVDDPVIITWTAIDQWGNPAGTFDAPNGTYTTWTPPIVTGGGAFVPGTYTVTMTASNDALNGSGAWDDPVVETYSAVVSGGGGGGTSNTPVQGDSPETAGTRAADEVIQVAPHSTISTATGMVHTTIPLTSWTARGGLNVDVSMHHSASNQPWKDSFTIVLSTMPARRHNDANYDGNAIIRWPDGSEERFFQPKSYPTTNGRPDGVFDPNWTDANFQYLQSGGAKSRISGSDFRYVLNSSNCLNNPNCQPHFGTCNDGYFYILTVTTKSGISYDFVEVESTETTDNFIYHEADYDNLRAVLTQPKLRHYYRLVRIYDRNVYLDANNNLKGNVLTVDQGATRNGHKERAPWMWTRSVTDQQGRSVQFHYDDPNPDAYFWRPTSVADPSGRVWKFTWEGDLNLKYVFWPKVGMPGKTGPQQYFISFEYAKPAGFWLIKSYFDEKNYKWEFHNLGSDNKYAGRLKEVYNPTGYLTLKLDYKHSSGKYTFPNGYKSPVYITWVEDPNGHKRQYHYEDTTVWRTSFWNQVLYHQGRLRKVIDENGEGWGHEENYDYDVFGNPTGRIDKNGNHWSGSYDIFIADATPDGRWTQSDDNKYPPVHGNSGNMVSTTAPGTNDANGVYTAPHTVSYTYNSLDQVLTVKDPIPSLGLSDRITLNNTYDDKGNLLTTADALGHTTTYDYWFLRTNGSYTSDPNDPNGHQPTGLRYKATNQLSYATTYNYDTYGNLTQVTDPNLNASRNTYETCTAFDADGNTISFSGALLGWKTSDAIGYSDDVPVSSLKVTDYTLDAWGRTREVKVAGITQAATEFDEIGNVVKVTDGNGNATNNVYDGLRRLVTVSRVRKAGVTDTVTNVYDDGPDQHGLLSRTINGNGVTTKYYYDNLRRKTSAIYAYGTANARSELWSYNYVGRLASHRDMANQTTSFDYDAANRLIRTRYPYPASGFSALANTLFFYDEASRRYRMVDDSGETRWYFDAADRLGQMTATTTPGAASDVRYIYDDINRRTHVDVYEGGLNPAYDWGYGYDPANRLIQVTSPYGEVATLDYNRSNLLLDQTNYKGSVSPLNLVSTATYRYEDYQSRQRGNTDQIRELITSIQWKNATGATQGAYYYTYDLAGNVDTHTRAGWDWNYKYAYDGFNQLTAENKQRNNATFSSTVYDYDANGNRILKQIDANPAEIYTYEPNSDRLSRINQGSANGTQLKSIAYDANGNARTIVTQYGTATLAYDVANQARAMAFTGGPTDTFVYNGLGLRVQKIDSGGTTRYVNDGADVASPVLLERNGSNTDMVAYTPGIIERRSGQSRWYMTDTLGSTRGLVNASQVVTDTFDTDAFGIQTGRTGSTATPFRYAGKHQYQLDYDSGFMLLGHRYYDNTTGRFLSLDPAQDESNWYSYCGNNPLSGTDSTGLDYWDAATEIDKNSAMIQNVAREAGIQPELLAGAVWVEAYAGNVPGLNYLNRKFSDAKFINNEEASLGLTQVKMDPKELLPNSTAEERRAFAEKYEADTRRQLEMSARKLAHLARRPNRYPRNWGTLTRSSATVFL